MPAPSARRQISCFFLNPDTELVDGTLERLVQAMRDRPRVGLVAVRQVAGDGTLWPSLHRFPSVGRAMAAALASEKWPVLGERLGERVLDVGAYERTGTFDWTTGAVLAVRREAFEAGRVRRALLLSRRRPICASAYRTGLGAHVEPGVTFVHHAGKAGVHPAREAQMAHARMQYARKHSGRVRAASYRAVLLDAPRDAAGKPAAAREHADVERARSVAPGAARVARHRKRRRTGCATGVARAAATVDVMGLPFHRVDARALIGHFVEGARTGTGGWIVTPNLDILRQYTTSAEARELILEATHRVADGLADRVGVAARRNGTAGACPAATSF